MEWDWEAEHPRLSAAGIPANNNHARGWIAQRLRGALEGLADTGFVQRRLTRGLSYAESGQILAIQILPGEVRSCVLGTRPKPYQTRLRAPIPGPTEWRRVIDEIHARPTLRDQLLEGRLPLELEGAFRAAEIALFPSFTRELHMTCTCPDDPGAGWGRPCKHCAATIYLLGERMDADPSLLLRWRGCPPARLRAALRAPPDRAAS